MLNLPKGSRSMKYSELRYKPEAKSSPVITKIIIGPGRTLAMLPEPSIPRVIVKFHNPDGSCGSSEVLLAADVVFD